MADFRINHDFTPLSKRCADPTCNHAYGAHGTNGMVCASCRCRQFQHEFQHEAVAMGTVIDPLPKHTIDKYGVMTIKG